MVCLSCALAFHALTFQGLSLSLSYSQQQQKVNMKLVHRDFLFVGRMFTNLDQAKDIREHWQLANVHGAGFLCKTNKTLGRGVDTLQCAIGKGNVLF